jgi:hypothetical protein
VGLRPPAPSKYPPKGGGGLGGGCRRFFPKKLLERACAWSPRHRGSAPGTTRRGGAFALLPDVVPASSMRRDFGPGSLPVGWGRFPPGPARQNRKGPPPQRPLTGENWFVMKCPADKSNQPIVFHRFCGFRGTTVDHIVLIAGGAAGDQKLAGTRKRPDASSRRAGPVRSTQNRGGGTVPGGEAPGRAQPRVIPARRGPPGARRRGGAGGAEPKKQFHVGVRFLSCGER